MTITTNYGDAELSPAEMARDNLLRLVADIRVALGTPDNMDVVQHASNIARDVRGLRGDLADALQAMQSTREALHAMSQFVNRLTVALAVPDGVEGDAYVAYAAQVAADAAQWREACTLTVGRLVELQDKAAKWDAVPVAEISRWAYDWFSKDDERKIYAWMNAVANAQEVTTE